MRNFEPLNHDFETRVRESFTRQKLMTTLGANLTEVSPGKVAIEMPFNENFTQQHEFIHAGIISAIVDSACGYAAFSLMPADAEVLSIEYKVNFLSPAIGEKFIARGQVVKAGRTITVCEGDVTAINEGKEKTVATMLATMISIKKE
ncbi:MAG TPA: PaaI family thioesterase [Pyrinomonadaceae bacterium]|nr:PaaI family thioesterase [Pyrinomonadaceae bacterium]